MRIKEHLSLKGRVLLLIGNGPSSWWIKPDTIALIRQSCSRVTISGCNRVGALLGCDVVGAIDRKMIVELMNSSSSPDHAAMVFESQALNEASVAGEFIPVDGVPWCVGREVFLMESAKEGTSTGAALFAELIACGPDATILTGFDGGCDPRTREQDMPHYKHRPALPHILDHWLDQMRHAAVKAIASDVCGPVIIPDCKNENVLKDLHRRYDGAVWKTDAAADTVWLSRFIAHHGITASCQS